jgi:trans-aconitate methyltransferase
MQSYTESAAIYDAIYHFKNYGKEVEYVLARIQERTPEARTLLDVACGTGNHIDLLKQQFEVEGLDLSVHMLEVARRKFPQVRFHQADMTGFSLGRRFDLVICLFRSIAYVRTPEKMHAAILSMAQHVAPGGMLIVEPSFTPANYWVDRVTLNEVNETDFKVAWMYVSKRMGNVSVLDTHYVVGRPSGVTHFREVHEHGLFEREHFQNAFRDAGLRLEYDSVGPTNVGLYLGRKPV